jgi:hypothetical protein
MRLPFVLASLAICTATGCGDPDPAVDPDATPPPQMTLDAVGAKLVAIQPDGGDWQVVAAADDGTFSFDRPDGAYALAYVCQTNTFLEVETILAGPDDGDAWGDVCARDGDHAALDIVTGFSASVFVGHSTWNVPNTGTTTVPTGVLDIAMMTRTDVPYFGTLRDVVVDGPTQVSASLGDFVPMYVSELQVTGTLGAGAHSESELTIGHDTHVQLQGIPTPTPTSLFLAPPDALRAGDEQVHRLVTSNTGAGHWVEVDRGPGRGVDPVAVTLDGDITATIAGVGHPVITVASPPSNVDVVRAEVVGPDTGAAQQVRWQLSAHPGWLAAHPFDGIVELPDLSAAPGWDAAWSILHPTDWGVRLGEQVADGVIRGPQFYVRALP